MKKREVYHTALRRESEAARPNLDFYRGERGFVFQHDITRGTHPEFVHCDCVYAEPAWKKGYNEFQRRAATPSSATFIEYITTIERVVKELGKPAYIIGGKHMLRYIKPTSVASIKLNGFEALVLMWNAPTVEDAPDVTALQLKLAQRYNCVLDFCCGYGNHLARFQRFIASDVNGKCVHYVAQNLLGYTHDS